MNEREETLSHVLHESPPPVLAKALEAAGIAIALAGSVKSPLRSLADQVVRAAASVPANIAEGEGRSGKDRSYHWRVAYGSGKELDVHLRLLLTSGSVDATRTARALVLLDEVRAMLWRIIERV